VTHRVEAVLVQPMGLDHPAVRARLDVSGQLDIGDELLILGDVSIDQGELGQGEQQLAPPLDRGKGSFGDERGRVPLNSTGALRG
jgi:hypothetical protein